MPTRADMLTTIEELCFACLDMNLYLDAHPDDKNATNTYNKLCSQLGQARISYEKKYGPINNFGYSPIQYPNKWVDDAWPWDNEFYER